MPPATSRVETRPVSAPAPGAARVGITLPNRLPVLEMLPVAELVRLATRAEGSGLIGSVWAGDSLLTKPRLESLTLLAAVAARTTRVRIGTMCLASFAFREPTLLAIQAASVDQLSGGRLVLGIAVGPGSGGGPAARAELARFGLSGRARLDVFETGVRRLRGLWGQAGVAGKGPGGGPGGDRGHAPVEPRPLQRPLPILIAGTPPPGRPDVVARVLDRVARLGDGWIADALSPARFTELRAVLFEAAERHGRAAQLRESVVHVPVVVAASRGAARRDASAFLARHLGVAAADVSLPDAGAYGPPGLVADHLDALLDAGVDAVVLRIMSQDPHRQLDSLLTDVLPVVVGAPMVEGEK